MKNTNIFSNRITQLESTAVSEMLKHISSPNVIPFAAGNPSPEAFPKEIIAEIATEILNKNPITALQYGKTEGYLPLRESLVDFLGSDFNADNAILITSGATQGIELITKTFTNEGDLVICENPTFIGTLNAFRSYNLDVKGIPMESDGINIQALENALKEAKEKGKNVRFIYTIPNFQNPSGATLSLQKRESMYRLALEHNVLILEDDPYGDLRYFGEHIPSIKSMDTKGIVLYAGSFSKIISPGLRVGYLVVHERFFEKLTAAKQVSDVHNPLLCQMIIHEFMKRHGLDNHIAEIRKIYKRKLTLTLELLEMHMKGKIEFVEPEGGLYIYCRLPDDVDAKDYCKRALQSGAAVVHGSVFSPDHDAPNQNFRINFTTPTDEQLKIGIKILGDTPLKM